MNTEIEKIIDSILANGELTDRSRELLMKKAEQLGVDLLDFELELESKIAHKKASIRGPLPIYTSTPQSNKEGDLKKCPSCGASVQSFTTKCPECGHEYRNTNASKSIKELFDRIQVLEQNERSKPVVIEKSLNSMFVGNYFADIEKEKRIANIIANAVSTFPVPNTKEDILEFLSLALPQATIKIRKALFQTVNDDIPKETMKKSWKSKCGQIIMKARFSMKDDTKSLEEIEYYAKQLGIK